MENQKEQLATSLSETTGKSSDFDSNENVAPLSTDAPALPPAPGVETLPAYQKLQQERAELYDRLLRKQAELDNLRKRAQREKEEFRKTAEESLIRDLLPVLDGFERAFEKRTPAIPQTFYEGMELIHRQLLDVLARAGLEPLETVGQLFDPHYHQAVETVEDAGRRDHEIVEELQRGYKLKHHLLRPAIVKVAVKPREGGLQAAQGRTKAG
jgi:molecular chaperone GrpE